MVYMVNLGKVLALSKHILIPPKTLNLTPKSHKKYMKIFPLSLTVKCFKDYTQTINPKRKNYVKLTTLSQREIQTVDLRKTLTAN